MSKLSNHRMFEQDTEEYDYIFGNKHFVEEQNFMELVIHDVQKVTTNNKFTAST